MRGMSHEIELRFHIPAESLERVQRWLQQGGPAERLALRARYFDTAERGLARAGIGLRLRQEGGQWVQTVKGPSADGLTRGEHNVELAAEPAQPDPALHAPHALGAALAKLLAEAPLQPTFATDIQRLRKPRRLPGGARIELALDEGRLLAAGREQAVHELELELLAGPPGALLAYAHALLARLPLSLDLRSKAERGERLARGESMSPPRKARAPALRADMGPAEALRCLLLGVFEQIGANASQIGSGQSAPEHLHQLRVGLRRLRALLALFRGQWPALDALELDRKAADWMRSLGLQRDQDMLGLELQATLNQALQAAGLEAPGAAPLHDGGAAAAAQVRQLAAQQFLLEVMGAALALEQLPPPARRLPALIKPPLRRWWKRLCRDAADFAVLDAEGLHALRKRCKRLRYALELCAPLLRKRRLQSLLPLLRELQALLGDLHDLELALARQPAATSSTAAAFAQGWLRARHAALRAQALSADSVPARLARLGRRGAPV